MRTVLITSEFSQPLAGMMAENGLLTVHVPLVRLLPTGCQPPPGFPDVVLVSSAAVARFVPDLRDYVSAARVVTVGPATAAALQAAGVRVDDFGDSGGVKAMGLLKARKDDICWYVGAENPSPALSDELDAAGIVRWPVYRSMACGVARDLQGVEPDVVCFTSGSSVRRYHELFGIPRCRVVVLGGSTGDVARTLGMKVDAMPPKPSLQLLADATAKLS